MKNNVHDKEKKCFFDLSYARFQHKRTHKKVVSHRNESDINEFATIMN
jgi:hypothetical protein